MLISFSAFSQQRGSFQKRDQAQISPEQRAVLNSKQLALKLDLTEAQQAEVEKLFTQRAKERKSLIAERKKGLNKKRTKSVDKFSSKNRQLDKRLAHQEKMKEILTAEQYEKWKSLPKNEVKKKARTKKRKI